MTQFSNLLRLAINSPDFSTNRTLLAKKVLEFLLSQILSWLWLIDNITSCRPVWSVIILLGLNKLDSPDFVFNWYDYWLNWTPLSPIRDCSLFMPKGGSVIFKQFRYMKNLLLPGSGYFKKLPPPFMWQAQNVTPLPPPPLRTRRASGCEIAYNTCSFVKVKVSECALNFGCKFVVVYLHFRKNDSYMALASRTNLKFCCLRISIYALTILYYNYNWPRQMTRGWVLLLLNIKLHLKGFNKLIYIGTFK